MGERHRVRGGEARQQTALVTLVVEQHDLAVADPVGELATLGGVTDGDGQGELGRDGGGAIQRDPALHEGADHGEEAATGARDRRAVHAVLVDIPVAVQQIGPRDADAGEVQAPVVDAVEPALEAIVLAADARQEVDAVADRHEERVHAVVDALDDQLREHDGGLAVLRGVAEVVLPGGAERGVDDELVCGLVERGRGADGGDIRPVARLGHGERAGRREAHDAGQELLVRALGAEVHDGGAEQAPLHAGLDLHRRVADDELLEARDVPAVVLFAAERLREGAVHDALLDQALQLTGGAQPVLRHRRAGEVVELLALQQLARVLAGLGPAGEEHLGERGRIHPDAVLRDGGGRSAGCGGKFDGVGHDGLLKARAEHVTPAGDTSRNRCPMPRSAAIRGGELLVTLYKSCASPVWGSARDRSRSPRRCRRPERPGCARHRTTSRAAHWCRG